MKEFKFRPYIETVSGKIVHFLNPDPDSIDINDIAHALSRICRFNGHTREFYSVAEHSWKGATYISDEYKLAMLLHDASEAYLCDIPSPVKDYIPDYKKIEEELSYAICVKFGLPFPNHEIIKYYDLVLLSNEAHHLMHSRGNQWELWKHVKRPLVSAEFKPLCLQADVAKEVFLDKFYELHGTERSS